MPLYEYQCQDCATVFKERRPFALSSDTAACPTCESLETRKLLGMVAFISNGRTTAASPIPLNMSGGGCGCGSCSCGAH